MIDQWRIVFMDEFEVYLAFHETGLTICGPQPNIKSAPSGYVFFDVANTHEHNNYQEIVHSTFPGSIFDEGRYFLLAECDLAMIKLAST